MYGVFIGLETSWQIQQQKPKKSLVWHGYKDKCRGQYLKCTDVSRAKALDRKRGTRSATVYTLAVRGSLD